MTVVEYDVTGYPDDPEQPFGVAKVVRRKKGKKQSAPVELPPELDRFRLYTDEDLGNLPPVTWLIPDYLAAAELTVLFGKGDTFKSFVALDWAAFLAAKGQRVVYIAAEGASGLKARVEAWKTVHKTRALPTLFLMPTNVALQNGTDVGRWVEAMRLQLEPFHPTLVVVDTLARNFVGGNENDAKDMGMFVEGVERIRRDLKTAVVVIHHATKDGKTERGGESLRNASFAVYEFTKMGGGGSLATVDVKCDRMKDAEPPPVRRLKPEKVALPALGKDVSSLVAGWSFALASDSQSASATASAFTLDERTLVRALPRALPRANTATLSAALKWKRTKTQSVLRTLVERGILTKEGQGRGIYYELSEGANEGS